MLLGVVIIIFVVLQFFSPTQRAALYVRNPQQFRNIDQIIEKYHLNEPAYVQFFYWISEVLNGNLGWSKSVNMPVAEALMRFLPATLELMIFTVPITIFVGIKLGVTSAINRDKPADHITRGLAIAGYSLPAFWLGLMLLMIFYGFLTGFFPPGRLGLEAEMVVNSAYFVKYTSINTIDGILNLRLDVVVDALRHLILPIATLTIINLAFIMRIMRSSMLETLNKDYITMARAKGLDEKTVVNKHAKRNALIPAVTVAGYLVASLMAGAVLTETVFNYKGLGWWSVNAAVQLDIPAVLGFVLFIGTVIVITNLIVDLLYAKIDPRIRLG
ncbi:MAG: ABC transporter permease [Candidatus Hadarchaeaceae archaeon]